FIRSMASRGSLGGLATKTKEVLDLMDRFGFEHVLVETVGVGQTELEIASAADTVIVVLVPESGDAIQAMKAGLMEIADIFVVNKADRPGSSRLVKEIRQALHLRAGHALEDVPVHHGVDLAALARGGEPVGGITGSGGGSGTVAPNRSSAWEIPVLTTNALTGEGAAAVVDAVDAHREWMQESGELVRRRRKRARDRVRDVVDRELRRAAWTSSASLARLEAGLDAIDAGEATPYSVARDILEALLR
ncbi:MAG TPA: hypothetical protein VLA09_04125, partial [Longimicrobiales bacterium]|nr:hypothetical protein [Longimicrobiales bacterium]